MSDVDWSAPFEQLRSGQRMRTRGRTVTEADVVGFAALTGDWHPQHADATWAATSRFGERIAHGMLILSYAIGLMPLHPERVVALRRVSDVIFKRPLRIGETMHADGRIAALAPVDRETGLVGCMWTVRNQDQALICRARIDVLWRRTAPDGPRDGAPLAGEPGDAENADRRATGSPPPDTPPLRYPRGVFPC
jgi:3-hydroxybutyryl-CoA dehydratase